MNITFKMNGCLLNHVRKELLRPHPFAAERVGFVFCRMAEHRSRTLIILAHSFMPIDDDDYIADRSVGALMGPSAIRKALQFTFNNAVGAFHIHLHNHSGVPSPSRTDLKETMQFVPDFWHVRPQSPHGALILSTDSMSGRCWYPGHSKPFQISLFTVVDSPLRFERNQL
jgi:hypothetical protein